jgi:hypothetical protein
MKLCVPVYFTPSESFSPSDVAGLVAWYKWDAGVLNSSDVAASTDDPIKTWQDQAGSFHLTQATSGFRPLFKGDHLLFDGVNDQLIITTGSIQVNGGATFIIWEPLATASGISDILCGGADDGQTWREVSQDGTSVSVRMYAGSFVNTVSYAYDVAHVTALIYAGVNSFQRKDGVATGPANTGTNSGTGLSVGANRNPEGGRAWKGKIKEILIYSVAPTGADLLAVEAYLTSRIPA